MNNKIKRPNTQTSLKCRALVVPSVNTTRMVSANTEDPAKTVMWMNCVNKSCVKITPALKDTLKNVESSTHITKYYIVNRGDGGVEQTN